MGDDIEMSNDQGVLTCPFGFRETDSGGFESYSWDSRLLLYGFWDL